jgi:hypothetical protein
LSLEITNDSRSERFRDLVARTFVEILAQDLRYGPWTVILRSERKHLSVVMTGPDDTREEWTFNLDRAQAPGEMMSELWERFSPGSGPSKRVPRVSRAVIRR